MSVIMDQDHCFPKQFTFHWMGIPEFVYPVLYCWTFKLFLIFHDYKKKKSLYTHQMHFFYLLFKLFHMFIWQHQVTVAVLGTSNLHSSMRTLSCSIWDLVPWPGIEPGPPALGTWSLSHWTTGKSSDTLLCPWTQLIFLVGKCLGPKVYLFWYRIHRCTLEVCQLKLPPII